VLPHPPYINALPAVELPETKELYEARSDDVIGGTPWTCLSRQDVEQRSTIFELAYRFAGSGYA
jgi:hypothetical protein